MRSLALMPYAFNQTGKSGQEALTNFDLEKSLVEREIKGLKLLLRL